MLDPISCLTLLLFAAVVGVGSMNIYFISLFKDELEDLKQRRPWI